jgi:penicillin-binding protein 1A
MLKLEKISDADYQAAQAAPIGFNRSEVLLRVGTYSWFVDAAIEDIIADLVETYSWTEQVAQAKLFNGGLKIHLTQSPEVQKAVDDVFRGKAADGSLAWFQPAGKGGEVPQGAMVVMDPRTGDILGLAGGSGEKQQSRGLNRATQSLRQPGSVIKPLAVYAPAVEQGLITEAKVFDDAPIHLQGADGQSWDPVNFEGQFKGLTTVKEALAESNNIVAIRVLFELGIDAAIESLRKLGITTIEEADRNGTLALGGLSRGVSVRQVAGAYATMASGGVYRKPRSYSKVEDANGQVLLEPQPAPRQALSPATAGIMTDLMEEVFKSGTGKGYGLEDLGIACAGKSGTTNEVRDKWFAGYTPYLLGVVWFGFVQPRSFPELAQPKKIWHAVMENAHRGLACAKADFTPPAGLVRAQACLDSGQAPGADCGNDPRTKDGHSRIAEFLFTQETVPSTICEVHQPARAVCTLSGSLATPGCPPETVAQVSYIKKPEPWQPPQPGDPPTLDAVYEWKELPPCPLHGGAAQVPGGPGAPSPDAAPAQPSAAPGAGPLPANAGG